MSRTLTFEDLLTPHATGDDLDRLVRYATLLERWSVKLNLVSWRDRSELVDRHLVDALAARPLLAGTTGALLDVGSGAGLPGVPLLIVCHGWRGVLLEPRHKRWAFLRQVIREIDLPAEAHAVRYQGFAGDGGPFDVITTRALGGYPGLLEWARGHLAGDGRVLIWGTADLEQRLSRLREWRVLSSPAPSLDRGRLLQLQPCFT